MGLNHPFSPNLWRILMLAALITTATSEICQSNSMTYGTTASSNGCSPAGDVDNDNIPDIICGAFATGSAYLIFGRTTPFPASWSISSAIPSDGVIKIFGTSSDPTYGFGVAVNGLGDINGDNYDDFAVSDPLGAIVYIFYGKDRASWTANIDITTFTTGVHGFKIFSTQPSYLYFGWDVQMADFDDDGTKDIVIAVYNKLEAWVIWGHSSSWTDINVYTTTATTAIKISGGSPCQYRSVTSAGDINNDGAEDLVFACRTTKTFVLFGKTGVRQNRNLNTLLSPTDMITITHAGKTNSVYSVTGLGDVNHDGVDDFIVSNYVDVNYIVFGKADITDFELAGLGAGSGVKLTGMTTGGGTSSGPVGDLNGDGYNDVIINQLHGFIYLIFGGPYLTNIGTIEMYTASPTMVMKLNGNVNYKSFILDMNNDGNMEIYYGSTTGVLYQLAPCSCASSEYNSGYSCKACSTLHADCTTCTNANTCASCSGGKRPQGAICIPCTLTQYWTGSACAECSTVHADCTACSNSNTCTACSGGKTPQGANCACTSSQYWTGSTCTGCSTVHADCTACSDANTCTACSGGKHALGATCISCSGSEYWTGSACAECSTVHIDCTACSNSNTCTACSGGKTPQGADCACTSSQYWTGSTCAGCSTVHADCTACSNANTCTACSAGKTPQGANCACTDSQYWEGSTCEECSTLHLACTACTDANTCTACSGGSHAVGDTCISCTPSQYWTGSACEGCSTVNADCTACNNANTCTSCSGGKHASGTQCISCRKTQYWTGSTCADCSTLNSGCTACTDANTCTSCSRNLIAKGSQCVTSDVDVIDASSGLSTGAYVGIGVGIFAAVSISSGLLIRRLRLLRMKSNSQLKSAKIDPPTPTEKKSLTDSPYRIKEAEEDA